MFSIKRLPIIVILISSYSLLFAQSPPPAKLTAEQWHEDLRYFATNMEKTHKNLFHSMTRAQFEAALRKLDERLPTLSEHEIIVELMRIVAMIGDGHTAVRANQKFTSVYPLRLYLFKDGLFVRGAAPEYRDAVGARVLKIGNADVEQALRAVRDIAWRDNEMGVKAIAPMLLVVPEVLHALRLADSLEKAEFVVEKEGRQIKIELKPSAQFNHLRQPPSNWIDAARLDAKSPAPLWLKDPQNIFWYEYLKEPNLLYVQFNGVANKPDETVEAFFKRVFEFIEANQVDKLVLDVRLNGGGNNFLNLPLTIGTIKSRVNKRGKLFVITGRDTFSAAQNTVNELEKYTNAIFVGEPTAASPNHYGDSRNITLPNSKLVVRASTLWWQDADPRDTRKWTAPEIAAELSSSDYFKNHDPAMAAILQFDPSKSFGEITARALTAADIASFIKEYRAYKADPAHVYVDTEAAINRLGYDLLGRTRPEDLDKAIEVFKLNVDDYPRSANVYDSLAEAYLKKGNKELAVKFYSKALELDPNFPSAIEALRQLKAN
jgi:tetratricopeptide (TPR) repeat protein